MEYFTDYMKKFDLQKYICYNKEALKIKRADSYDITGKWDAEIRDHKTGEVENAEFDGVLVCTGHHAQKKVPTFEGQDEFEGEIMHSQDFKHAEGWKNKKGLVVGIGNSGVDVAIELSKVTDKVRVLLKEYYMSVFISHVISTRDSHISPR